jgi:transposase-like protein
MSKTTNKFSPEVRTRAMRMALEHGGEIRRAGLP